MADASGVWQVNPALLKFGRGKRGAAGGAALIREVMELVGRHWHKNMLKKHFEPSAPSRYPGAYTKRTKLYQLRKAKRGHQNPMVFSGAMRRQLLGTKPTFGEKKFESRTVRVKLQMPSPRAANLWTGRRAVASTGQAHNFAKELTAVNRGELQKLAKLADRLFARVVGQAFIDGSRKMIKKRMTG